jgi:cytochrome oxidase assembly protein ShyY1
MLRILLRPRIVALTIACVAAVVVMVNLALWQYDRHVERREFNATLTARFNEDPMRLEDLLGKTSDLAQLEWLPAIVVGEYLPTESLSVVNVSQYGQAGFDPVTPLRLADGRLVLINRGFVPLSSQFPDPPSGEVTVVGRVRLSAERRTGAVTDPASGRLTEVQRIDIPRIAQQLEANTLPVYLEALTSTPADDPMLSQIADPDFTLGPHLSYVVQWLVFSLFVVVGWVFVVRRESRKASATSHE